MKIILINKFYHDKSRSGGVGRHILELEKILEKNSHEVIPFAIEQKETKESIYKEYFPKEISSENVGANFYSIKNALKLFYNQEACENLEKLIKKTTPDIAHVHNIYHHLTPAILKVLKKNKIPIVMTVHDYKLICPNYSLFQNGLICEQCKGAKFYNCLKNKCSKNSYVASAALMMEAYFVNYKKYYNLVDIFVTPSEFMKKKLIEFGYDEGKIVHVPNFLFETQLQEEKTDHYENSDRKYFLYFGRLSIEKGLDTLIQSVKNVNLKNYHLKIAGAGDQEKKLRNLAEKMGLSGAVEFVGHKNFEDMKKIISGASFVVLPSVWHENAPYTVLEAYAQGKAVIGSDQGGIPELIKNRETGLIFKANNPPDLAEKISTFISYPNEAKIMGLKGQKLIMQKYNAQKYYDQIKIIYESLLGKKQEK